MNSARLLQGFGVNPCTALNPDTIGDPAKPVPGCFSVCAGLEGLAAIQPNGIFAGYRGDMVA